MSEWIERGFQHFLPIGLDGVAALREYREEVVESVAQRLAAPLEAYALLLGLSRSLSATYPVEGTEDDAVKARVLQGLHARSCAIGAEIEVLARNGFEDGLWARSRTLHELRVIATLVAREPAWRARLFEWWTIYDEWRAYRNYVRSVLESGGTPHRLPNEAEFEEAALEARHGVRQELGVPTAQGSYGWMATPKNPRPTLAHLEQSAGLSGLRSWYLIGNKAVHVAAVAPGSLADPMSLDPLADDDYAVLLDCLGFAAQCLRDVVEAVSGMRWHHDPEIADAVHPLLLAIEGARRAITDGIDTKDPQA